jgi:hypothetical protein
MKRKANAKRLKQLEVEMQEMGEKLKKAKCDTVAECKRNLSIHFATCDLLSKFNNAAYMLVFRPGVPASTKKMSSKLLRLNRRLLDGIEARRRKVGLA